MDEFEFRNPVQDWIVELAKEAGLDISGYKHKVTQEFKKHTLSHHGNISEEDKRGQIAVTEMENRIILVKNTDNGAILFEEVLSGRRNKALNAKTLLIKKGKITGESLFNILESNARNDVTNFKIKYADAVVAKPTDHSTQTVDGGSNLRPRSSIN